MVIVAAVDRSERSRDAVEQASALAQAFEDEIHVAHVLSYAEFADLERTSVENTGRPKPVDDIRRVAADIAEEAVGDLEGPFEFVGLVGHAANSIVDYAAEEDARYIVTAGRKRSPTGKAIFGSVAQSIVMNAQSPVVVSIKHDD